MPTPEEMAVVFERLRTAVFQEGTRPTPYDATKHAANQARFKSMLREVCDSSHLRPDMAARELWYQVWTKIRYAGFRAAYVANVDIPHLEPFLKDFRALAGPEWRFDPERVRHGKAVREFLKGSGRFAGIRYNRNERKLRAVLRVAAAFRAFPAGVKPLVALFGEGYDRPDDDALWRAHGRLAKLVGFAATLHVLMDLGFNCVKPDIWLVRLMCGLGWIEDVLPPSTPDEEIRRDYGKPRVARSVIARARQIAPAIHAWNPCAPLREFDLVMVKYGQDPDVGCGIERSLFKEWGGVERVMEWPLAA